MLPGSSEQFYPAESSFYAAARLSRLPVYLQAVPRAVFPCFQAILPGRIFIQQQQVPVEVPRVAVEEEF